jgi:acetylornithine/succinyldiaminopimelate/putrescine aminotransferase/Ser/Thr protein kinase RdoA (MazF antagonist)
MYLPPGKMSEKKRQILQDNHAYLYPGRVQRLADGGVDFVPGEREGYRYWDVDGREIYDLHLNGGTFNLGHRHPELVALMQQAVQTWDIGNHHFPSEPKARLAKALVEACPGDMQYVVFTPSGSEANDVAIKSARHLTGRRKIVALDAGYHGRSGLSGAAGDDEVARYFLSDYPGEFIKVPFNDIGAMEEALRNGDVALVMMESIPATYGFPIPSDDYLPAVKALCEKYGTLFLADEVQTGLGRTGYRWGIEAWGVEPDFLVSGKGLSGGLYPMAAVVMSAQCGNWLNDNGWGHVSTFGGSDLGCVVALKALELCLSHTTLANVKEQARYIRQGLEQIMPRFPFFTGIRQKGLVMGLEFIDSTSSWMMMKALYECGIWAIVAAFDETVLQFKPGLLIDREYCDEVLSRFEEACIWLVNHGGELMMASAGSDDESVAAATQIVPLALSHWGLENAEFHLIKHRENSIFKVLSPSGEQFALRIHRPGYHSERELQSELLWMQALAEDGIATPPVVPAKDGECTVKVSDSAGGGSRYCSLLAWVDGDLFDNLGRVENGVVPELKHRYRALGALAARLHNQSECWQKPENFQRHAWDSDGLLGDDPLWGRFWEHPLISVEQRPLILKARIVLQALLDQIGQGGDCYGLIHADFLPDNILVHDGELLLIDFDDCGFGWHMFEMATSLFPKISEPYFDELVEQYVAGYRSERNFSDEHLEIFPAFILLRGLTYLGWLMTRAGSLQNGDKIAQEIINGLCEHIPELMNELNPVQKLGVNVMAWWQARTMKTGNMS